jgi:hypothetical protein
MIHNSEADQVADRVRLSRKAARVSRKAQEAT